MLIGLINFGIVCIQSLEIFIVNICVSSYQNIWTYSLSLMSKSGPRERGTGRLSWENTKWKDKGELFPFCHSLYSFLLASLSQTKLYLYSHISCSHGDEILWAPE